MGTKKGVSIVMIWGRRIRTWGSGVALLWIVSSPAAAQVDTGVCLGDCDGNGVTVGELVSSALISRFRHRALSSVWRLRADAGATAHSLRPRAGRGRHNALTAARAA
jgi:hypothetical protein